MKKLDPILRNVVNKDTKDLNHESEYIFLIRYFLKVVVLLLYAKGSESESISTKLK